MQAKTFVFGPYRADWEAGKLEFDYRIEFSDAPALEFTEKIEFAGGAKSFNAILPHLSLVLGISYYKLYVPPEIEVPFELTENQAEFWNTVYRKGLGEFWYRNNLEPRSLLAHHPVPPRWDHPLLRKEGKASDLIFSSLTKGEHSPEGEEGVLIGIGGGKDSIVATELLKQEGIDVTGFVVETERGSEVIDDVIEALKIPVLTVRRTLDPKLFEKHSDSFNGHVPVSAMYAFLGVMLAHLFDYPWVAVGNEYSSDFGNLEYRGETINHQWSKSSEFESIFQEYVRQSVTEDVTYFSLLRAFHEIRVVKQLVKLPIWNSVKTKFSSCNRNFVHHPQPPNTPGESPSVTLAGESARPWCTECPKCAFVFAMLAAFLPKEEVVNIFGKNLYADRDLVPMYRDLLGWGDMKPFDCVGTFEETRGAMWAARETFAGDVVIAELAGDIEGGEKIWHSVMGFQAAPTLPERFRLAGVERALILGYGREGEVTEKFLKQHYPHIAIGVADQQEGEGYLEKQKDFDLAIKTPGIPKRLVTVAYTTATNIFLARVPNLVIGVTGSKGKSTTASLIAAMLEAGGKRVQLLGNIGKPMLQALLPPHPQPFSSPEEKGVIYVLELSSQQLEDVTASPQMAVVTNLFPEHMDYHGSVEAYYAAKKNIIRYQKSGDVFIYDPQHDQLRAWAGETRGQAVPFAEKLPVKGLEISLPGEHNRRNIAAATAAARQVGVSDKAIAQAILSFKPLPHRLEKVGEFRGIVFYDNASSTTPESTIAALAALPQVETLFLGGLDRGYDFQTLVREIAERGVKHIVLFPDTGARLKNLLPGSVKTLETESMQEAVQFAYAQTAPGKTVLLAAASPSYSLWTNFDEQGNEFQKWVRALA